MAKAREAMETFVHLEKTCRAIGLAYIKSQVEWAKKEVQDLLRLMPSAMARMGQAVNSIKKDLEYQDHEAQTSIRNARK